MQVLLPSLDLTYCMGENLAEIKLGKLLHKETHKTWQILSWWFLYERTIKCDITLCACNFWGEAWG